MLQRSAGFAVLVRAVSRIRQKTHPRTDGKPLRNHLLQPVKSAAANKKNVARVNLQHLLVGVLAAALRRHIGDAAFNDFQQFLLDAFARHIPGDGAVDAFLPGNFVQLVNIDNPLLGAGNVPIGRLDEAQQNVLYVLADVPRFRKGGGVANRKRNFQSAGEGLRQQRFAGTGRPQQQDIGLLHFHILRGGPVADALEVVINGHGQRLFSLFLADYIGVQTGVDFPRHQRTGTLLRRRRLLRPFRPVAAPRLIFACPGLPPPFAPMLGQVVG